ncbi:MAG: hypothetical protein WD049_04940, partial [Candidatus Paceibacterota bacterium]
MTDWFAKLTGFEEESPDQVRSLLRLEGTRLRSAVNDAAFECGRLEMPTLGELRERLAASGAAGGTLRVS